MRVTGCVLSPFEVLVNWNIRLALTHPSSHSCVCFFVRVCVYVCIVMQLWSISVLNGSSRHPVSRLSPNLRGRALLWNLEDSRHSKLFTYTHTHPCARTYNARNSASIFEWVQSESMSNQCPSVSMLTGLWKTQHIAGWMDKPLHRERNQFLLHSLSSISSIYEDVLWICHKINQTIIRCDNKKLLLEVGRTIVRVLTFQIILFSFHNQPNTQPILKTNVSVILPPEPFQNSLNFHL